MHAGRNDLTSMRFCSAHSGNQLPPALFPCSASASLSILIGVRFRSGQVRSGAGRSVGVLKSWPLLAG
jgi:hypothetical protein